MYQQVGSDGDRLIIAHMPMVKRVAVHLRGRIPPLMELEELVQVGMMGLIEAARGFDQARGIEFEHFAVSRIRGAILDEVRRLSARPRSAVAFHQSETEASRALSAELGRQPSVTELAQRLGKEVDQYQKERDLAHRYDVQSMDVVGEEALGVADDASRQPETIVEQAQLMDALAKSIEELSEREKLVMQLYYVEELNLKEIGEVIGVTESRVSQILSATAKKLRALMGTR